MNKLKHLIKIELTTISCTIAIWISSEGIYYLGLTIHYINDRFERRNIMLGIIGFQNNHTCLNISKLIKEFPLKWDLSFSNIFCIIHDNAKNMIAAVREACLKPVWCINHTIRDVLICG